MKEGYIYLDGKIVSVEIDELGTKSYDNDIVIGDNRIVIRDYQDNIEDIFALENLIEELEKNKLENLEELEELNKKLEKVDRNPFASSATSTLCIIMVALITSLILNDFACFYYSLITSVIINFGYPYKHIKKEKELLKIINGINVQLEEIDNSKNKLESLLLKFKKRKTNNNEEKISKEKIKQVSYKDKLEELKYYIALFYDIGFFEKKFSKYYDKGKLEKKLKELYDIEEIDTIKTYFKSKKN